MKQGRKGGRYASTHGLRKHPLYMRLMIMRQRCENPKAPDYGRYGGKGVRVCYTWRNNPASFIRWAENNGWEPGLVVDRIDPRGDYEPTNCQFITASENSRRMPTRSRLSREDVADIRARAQNGETHASISKDYGVTRQHVSKIVSYKSLAKW